MQSFSLFFPTQNEKEAKVESYLTNKQNQLKSEINSKILNCV